MGVRCNVPSTRILRTPEAPRPAAVPSPGRATVMNMTKVTDMIPHRIWLAGLGAKEDPKLFGRLVQRGRKVQASPELSGVQVLVVEHDKGSRVAEGILSSLGAEVVLAASPQEAVEHLTRRSAGVVVSPSISLPERSFQEPVAPSAAETAQLRRNADARRVFLAEFGTLTSREVAEFAGSRAQNRAALANRWKAEGKIFAVESGGQTLFPAFQFSDDDGQPRPVIAEILAVLQPRYSDWQTALWFTGRNGWLGAKRPVDVLQSAPDAAVEAARQETEAFD
jgi:CheY-like chemotaxis protein